MLRKTLLRMIAALALILLVIGSYSGFDAEAPTRILDIVAERAKALGINGGDEDDHWDTVINVMPLLERFEQGDHRFDWADWIDLDKTKIYNPHDLDPKLYPYLSELTYNEKPEMPHEVKTSPQEQAMIARLYCKQYLTAPFRIVPIQNPAVEPDNGNILSASNSLRTAPMKQYEVVPTKKALRHRQFGHAEPTEYYNASEPLVPDLKAPADQLGPVNLTFPSIDESLFTWDTDDIMDFYEGAGMGEHALTIREALSDIGSSAKHFYEVHMRDDPVGYGVHYDWRFFRGILPHDEHVAATHALARTWQQFAEQMGIAYWYAHGSLLGYLWNGMSMPWDPDHDIQVPILELDRLARDFNRTLVVQHPSEGYRKYLIDVGPYYVQRIRGNGRNVIDARFIDVDSGVYIDITGLARTSPLRKLVSCKNRHLYHAEDFTRIRRVMYEGYPALIPADFTPMLAKEYRRYNTPIYKNWKFNFKIRLWEFKDSCARYLTRYKHSIHVYCFPQDIKKDDGCMSEFDTCDRVALEKFEESKDITALHAQEQEIFSEISPVNDKTVWDEEHIGVVQRLLDLMGEYHAPFRNSTIFEVDAGGEPYNPQDPQLSHA